MTGPSMTETEPLIDVFQTDERLVILMDIPGITKHQCTVNLVETAVSLHNVYGGGTIVK